MRLPTKALSLIGVGAIMAGLCVSGVGAAAVAVDPITQTVPTPYDDLSDRICDGTAITVARISTEAGRNQTALWALAGDTIEYVGSVKSCQKVESPSDALAFGFWESEVGWRLRATGQTISQATPITSGIETLQDGPTAIPTMQRFTTVAKATDEGSRLYFGVFDPVESPNGAGTVSGTTSLLLHIVDPKLSLTKEVCVFGTAAECDPSNNAAWVPSTEITGGADVFWRLTATNTGNITLNNIKVSGDTLANGTADSNSCTGAEVVASLAPAAKSSIVCKTPAVQSTGTATNTAKLTSTFVDPSPNSAFAPRFPNGVESNEASAKVTVLNPAVSLVKEVCVAGSACDPTVATDWTTSSNIPLGSAAVWRLTASNTGNTTLTNVKPNFEELSGGMTGTSAACAALEFGTLTAGASRSLTCETAGITDTTQATVNKAKIEGVPADDAGAALPQFTKPVESKEASAEVSVLAPAVKLVKEVCVAGSACDPTVATDWTTSSNIPLGSAAVWRLTASNTGNTTLTNVKPNFEELSGGMTGTSDACAALEFGTLTAGASRSLTCETAGITDTTQATVNKAKIEGVPADGNGVALPAFTKPIESNEASAEVSVLAPEVKLVKEVCVTGSQCDPTVAADWTASSTVASGSAAVWRLTASNTGNTTLTNVKPSFEELSGGMSGKSDACAALDFGTLAVGESRSLTCETANITNATQATVNTAKIEGVPADNAGVALPAFTQPIESDEATAEVSVLAPAVSLVKEVCVTGTKCDPTVAADWKASSTVTTGSAAVWRLTASNTGNTALTNVKPSFEELSGGMSGKSEACAALDFGTLAVGESRSLTCETAGITDTTKATVNTAAISGTPSDSAGAPLPQFKTQVQSAKATASVTVASTPQKKSNPGTKSTPGTKPDPSEQTNPGTPVDTATNPAAEASGLATTGGETSFALVAAASLLLIGGAGALFVRRRRA